MKNFFLNIILVVWFLSPSLIFAVEGDEILGEWVTEYGDSRVEIFKKDNQYFGKIVALTEPNYLPGEVKGMDGKPRLDLNNPKKSLRSNSLIGLELMKNFQFDEDEWIGGSIYDPEDGTSYKCKISLTEDGELHVRGYIGISLFGRTTVWESARVYPEK
jgi:uncharacterized protein (DUF2147 family)